MGFLLVLTGNVLRLGAGMAVFVVLARSLGPADFGNFSLWLAVATLAVIPVNFGFATAVLRQFGVEPQAKLGIMSAVLTAKLVLSFSMVVVVLLAASAWKPQVLPLLVPLLLAQVFESLSELYTLGFRAVSNYAAEAATASVVALAHIAIMIGCAVWFDSVEAVAIGFGVSRMLGMVITMQQAQRKFQFVPLASLEAAFGVMRKSAAYALELAFSTAYTQLDSLVINAALGSRAVGLYQAGMKLVQGFSRLAPIMAQYVLPRLAKDMSQSRSMRSAGLTILVFGSVGLGMGGLMAAFAEQITYLLFGSEFAPLATLMPLFGALLALRFVETGTGLVLVAAGMQSSKVWLVAAQLVTMLCVGWFALGYAGLEGWLYTTLACTVLLLCMYALLWFFARRRGSPK